MRAGAWRSVAAVGIAVAIAAGAWRLFDPADSQVSEPSGSGEDVARRTESEAGLSGSTAKLRADPAKTAGSTAPTPAASTAEGALATFSGVVVDHRGAPVEGAEVLLAGRRAVTGTKGEFVLPPVRPGPDGRIGDLVARKSGLGGTRLSLRVETPRELRLGIPPAAEVGGVVASPTGPVPDASVTWREDASDGDADAVAVESSARSGLDGSFRVPDASSLRGVLYVEAAHFVPEVVEVAPSATPRRVRVLLRPIERETGTRVVDGAGVPVAGARVEVHWDWPQRMLVGVTDARGVGPRVPAVPHGVSVFATDRRGARGGAQAPFTVDSDVTIVLEREDRVDVVVHAFGVALDELPSWSVAFAWSPVRSRDSGFVGFGDSSGPRVDESSWTSVDRFGRAVLHPWRIRGRSSVIAVRRDARGRESSSRLVAWKSETDGEAPERVEWRVPALAPVRVSVVATEDERPLESPVRVMPVPEGPAWKPSVEILLDRGGEVALRTGEDGVATAWVFPGRWQVHVQRNQFDYAAQTVDVPAQGTDVRLTLPRGRVLRGRIRMADGTPLPNRFVSFQCGGRWVAGRSDATGAFALDGAVEGHYEGWYEGARGEMGLNRGVFADVPGEPVECVVVPCTIRGEVRPLGSSRWQLWMATKRDGNVRIPIDLDERGGFEVTGLSAGDWTIYANLTSAPDRSVSFHRDVKVFDGAFFRLDADEAGR